jgi:hypothetical protein
LSPGAGGAADAFKRRADRTFRGAVICAAAGAVNFGLAGGFHSGKMRLTTTTAASTMQKILALKFVKWLARPPCPTILLMCIEHVFIGFCFVWKR